MNGWEISVYQHSESSAGAGEKGQLLALWQTRSWGGTDWLNELVSGKNAVYLGGDGFSSHEYSVAVGVLIPLISSIIAGDYVDLVRGTSEHPEPVLLLGLHHQKLDNLSKDEQLFVKAVDIS